MKTRNAFRSLCFAATLAALPGVAAIAADATARKSAATVGQALARALNERDAEAFMRNIDTGALVRIILKDLGLGERDAEALRQQLPASVRRNIETGMHGLEYNKAAARFMRGGVEERLATGRGLWRDIKGKALGWFRWRGDDLLEQSHREHDERHEQRGAAESVRHEQRHAGRHRRRGNGVRSRRHHRLVRKQ